MAMSSQHWAARSDMLLDCLAPHTSVNTAALAARSDLRYPPHPAEGPEPRALAMLSDALHAAFDQHVELLAGRKKRRREAAAGKSLLETYDAEKEDDTPGEEPMGAPRADDKFAGDRRLRTMYRLLAFIDDRGYERSSQQVEFHHAFITACGRILYREDWGLSKPDILATNGWGKSFSEVLISTPRRFGKTFRFAPAPPAGPAWPDRPLPRAPRRHLRRRDCPLCPARGGHLQPGAARLAQAARADQGVPRHPRRRRPRGGVQPGGAQDQVL